MKVAELFVKIGVKGSKETTDALKDVKTGMGDIATAAGAAVAAMAAGIYVFREFGKQSNQAGLQLDRFQTLTGMSADKLQDWQLLALKSGTTAEDMAQSLQRARDVISTMVLGKGMPAGLGALVNTPGVNFNAKKARDLNYVIQKIQEYARVTKNLPEAQHIMDSLGFSRNVQYALMQGGALQKAGSDHGYSQREVKTLKDMNIQWGLLGDKVEHAIGRLNVNFSPSLLKDLDKLTDSVIKLVTAVGNLATAWGLLHKITNVASVTSKGINFAADPGYSKPTAASRAFANSLVQHTHNTTITVQGAHDPELTAKIVKKHLDNQNNSALRSLPQSTP